MTNELTADGLRELVERALSPNQLEWYLPWRIVPDAVKPTIVGSNSGNLFRGYIGTWSDADLIVALVNAVPQIIALMEREARMKEALAPFAEIADTVEALAPNVSITVGEEEIETDGHRELIAACRKARAALQPKETDNGER